MIHSFVATVFGVGAFLQPAILRTELVKLQITGTLAACMLSMDIFKVIGFSTFGFNYLTLLTSYYRCNHSWVYRNLAG